MKRLIGLLILLIISFQYAHATEESACSAEGSTGEAFGLCHAFCDAMDCTQSGNATACASLRSAYQKSTGAATFPCEKKVCELIDPELLLERISLISDPEYVCYFDTYSTPYEYVEYIVESDGDPQIGLGLEDQFDGTWYGYYFEYLGSPDGALPEVFRYDLTAEDVQACRAAFEPPFTCP